MVHKRLWGRDSRAETFLVPLDESVITLFPLFVTHDLGEFLKHQKNLKSPSQQKFQDQPGANQLCLILVDFKWVCTDKSNAAVL